MGCQATLDFPPPPSADAHLSYYWTMNEAGDLNKVDSSSGHVWNATTGNSSPPGLFVNGIQLDCAFVGVAPFFHGLNNSSDAGLAFNSATSTGITLLFWIKQTTAPVNPELPFGTFFELSLECHDLTFTNDCQLFIELPLNSNGSTASVVAHDNFTTSSTVINPFNFAPVVGAWHMFAVTLDLVAHTLNVYLDGVLLNSVADNIGFLTAPMGDLLLRYSFGTPHLGVVIVDELLLSLKGAATPAQITAAYNGGAGVTWPGINAIFPFP